MASLFTVTWLRIARVLFAIGWAAATDVRAAAPVSAPDTATNRPARLRISGCGLLENRRLRQELRILQPTGRAPVSYDANFVEDAATMLLSDLEADGWLQAELRVQLHLHDGNLEQHRWNLGTPPALLEPVSAQAAHFHIRRGVRFHYRSLTFAGLHSLSPAEAERFFVPAESVIPLRGLRPFSPAGLRRGAHRLQEALQLRGYADARVRVRREHRNEKSGAVTVELEVEEGSRHRVQSVRVRTTRPGASRPEERWLPAGDPYSLSWQQALVRQLRSEEARHGFLDAEVGVNVLRRDPVGSEVPIEIEAQVGTGPEVRLGEVRVEGLKRTRTSVIRNRIPLVAGEPIDGQAAEEARQRLYRLGILDRVSLRFEPEAPAAVRDAVYEVKESRDMEVNLLAGYGSYELLRGGVEFEWNHLFGLANSVRIRGLQSFKSTQGNALYTVPDLLREDITGLIEGNVLRREEISFDREEYGGSAGVSRFFPGIQSTLGVRYAAEILRASDVQSELPSYFQESRAAGFRFDWKHDGCDNPVRPRRGFKLFGQFEVSSDALGASVDYQRLELSSAFHRRLPWGQILHLGLGHGVAFTQGDSAVELPLNRRFFPGGENSVRGYQYGEAAPRDELGRVIGAETYLLGNLELEQPLTPNWSVVGFIDAAGIARYLEDYPLDEVVWSVGGGIRLQTIVGPVRLEYGWNPDPRPGDPRGTLQFSFGTPF